MKWFFIGVVGFMMLLELASFAATGHAEAGPSLQIPALHISAQVGTEINDGPAWWPYSARPGQTATVAIAAHRTTHGGPFRYLNHLKRGDLIKINWAGKQHAYRVTGHKVEPVTNQHITDNRGHELLMLTACSRPDGSPTSISYRLVVYALPVK